MNQLEIEQVAAMQRRYEKRIAAQKESIERLSAAVRMLNSHNEKLAEQLRTSLREGNDLKRRLLGPDVPLTSDRLDRELEEG